MTEMDSKLLSVTAHKGQIALVGVRFHGDARDSRTAPRTQQCPAMLVRLALLMIVLFDCCMTSPSGSSKKLWPPHLILDPRSTYPFDQLRRSTDQFNLINSI